MEWYNSESPNKILVHGVSYIPNYDLNTPKTNIYKYNEIDDNLAKKTKNLPVLYEHINNDPRYEIGKVYDSFVDYKRNLHSVLLLDKNDETVERIIPGLYNKQISALSMGTKVELDTNKFTKVKSVKPEEISIVQTPDIKNCDIKSTFVVPKSDEKNFIKNVYENIVEKYK